MLAAKLLTLVRKTSTIEQGCKSQSSKRSAAITEPRNRERSGSDEAGWPLFLTNGIELNGRTTSLAKAYVSDFAHVNRSIANALDGHLSATSLSQHHFCVDVDYGIFLSFC